MLRLHLRSWAVALSCAAMLAMTAGAAAKPGGGGGGKPPSGGGSSGGGSSGGGSSGGSKGGGSVGGPSRPPSGGSGGNPSGNPGGNPGGGSMKPGSGSSPQPGMPSSGGDRGGRDKGGYDRGGSDKGGHDHGGKGHNHYPYYNGFRFAFGYDPWFLDSQQSWYFYPEPRSEVVVSSNGRIEVILPETAAQVWLFDYKTTSTGTTRVYETPSLEVGKIYQYAVKASWIRDGKTVTREQTVDVIQGRTTLVDFTKEPPPEKVPLPPEE